MRLDHVLHLAVSLGLVCLGAVAAVLLGARPLVAVAVGSVAALGISAAKELLWDLALRRGDPSWGDFAADVLGVAVGCAVLTLAVLL